MASPTPRTPTWSGAKPACRTSASPASSRRPCTRRARASCCRYNCSPFVQLEEEPQRRADRQVPARTCRTLGYKYQFITLAGIHINWYNTFQFAHAYASGEGMKHYINMVQEPEFAAREQGYTFVSHQQEVGTGYFDDVTTVIQGGARPASRR